MASIAQVDGLTRLRNGVSWLFGAALLAYEAWDVRQADGWLVAAALVLMGVPLWAEYVAARSQLEEKRERRAAEQAPQLYDQEATGGQ